jgi:hypothetical protein
MRKSQKSGKQLLSTFLTFSHLSEVVWVPERREFSCLLCKYENERSEGLVPIRGTPPSRIPNKQSGISNFPRTPIAHHPSLYPKLIPLFLYDQRVLAFGEVEVLIVGEFETFCFIDEVDTFFFV